MGITIKVVRRALALAAVLAGLGGAACSVRAEPAFLGKALESRGELSFALRATDGRIHRPADWQGQVLAVVFGYTHCPDYCPTTLARLGQATRLLPVGAAFQPLFVTLDPLRDTFKVLRPYVRGFHPAILGLRGNPAETEALAGQFRVLFEKVEESATYYSIDHSGGIFLVDRHGRLRYKEPDQLSPAEIAADISLLLGED
jgi:protein SCO1/2